MQAMSNSLRLKLRPFGVNVVLVLPSSMRSNLGRANLERLGNYEWKLYKDFKEVIEERARASQDDKAMDGRVFARHVVRKVLGPKPPKKIVFLSHDWFVCLALVVSPVDEKVMEIKKTKELNLSNDDEEITSQVVNKNNEKKGEGNAKDELGKLAHKYEEALKFELIWKYFKICLQTFLILHPEISLRRTHN
ncbi:hypothetical protein JHK82_047647 [Glycine max]|nr:hypothetical protein JHK85_048130 [Glycine max]KAG5097793.1 hypothetical protein JHK82_047647 [Glycine max]